MAPSNTCKGAPKQHHLQTLEGTTMAYSDYGGYAYRNGVRVVERSDCTINPDGDTFGTPGMWPGFVTLGSTPEHRDEQLSWPSGHAVLGDGPIYLVLYKQTATMLYRGPIRLNLEEHVENPVFASYGERTFLDTDHYKDTGKPLLASVDGCKISIIYEETDNHYQYAELIQPDGTIWTGWSGYGVGAGLEEADYGYSTQACEDRIFELFHYYT